MADRHPPAPVATSHRLALGVFYVAMGVRFRGGDAVAWLVWVFAAYEALVGVSIRHERHLVDAYPQALVAFEGSVGTAVPWQVDADSP